jgi:tetraacyldisaccharide 4'-kinase
VRRLADAAALRLQQSWWRPRADALARILEPLSWLYARALSRRAPAAPQPVGVPVVVVGNLIAGGAGKTPTVMAVIRLLRAAGWTPGVISRGYGGNAQAVLEVTSETLASDCGDEPMLIHRRTRVPVMIGRGRVAAARALLERHPSIDVIVSDDGLQHRQMARDVQVIVFDDRGVGNGLLLPAGPLREPLPDSVPPATLVLYNAGRPSTALPGWMAKRRLGGVLPLTEWRQGGPARALDTLRGRPLLAAAGIAEPERFFRMLEAEGLAIERCPLPDHHRFQPLPWPATTTDVIVTEKDAVKLSPDQIGTTRVWVAALDFDPDPAFNAALLRLLPPR